MFAGAAVSSFAPTADLVSLPARFPAAAPAAAASGSAGASAPGDGGGHRAGYRVRGGVADAVGEELSDAGALPEVFGEGFGVTAEAG